VVLHAIKAHGQKNTDRGYQFLPNLPGFDGSPEPMRKLQLEYGAEIGRAVVNFKGPMVFCVISRYQGSADIDDTKQFEAPWS